MERIKKFFKLEENGTTIKRELMAGATTFFAMAYILFVNPDILSNEFGAGMPAKAVFLATIFAAVAGTLVMALFANVPYAQAPGMGLNAFFSFTICGALGFAWQQALAMVFICGIINIVITVTKIRKSILKAIPKSLQAAIGAGIGLFIAYLGFINSGFIEFGAVPELSSLVNIQTGIAIFGLVLTVILLVLKVKGSILIGIGATTVFWIIITLCNGINPFAGFEFGPEAWGFSELGETFGAAFTKAGIGSLFSTDAAKLPVALVAIFAFSLTDTFDTIGTFIGTGKKSGIFSEEDEKALESGSGFSSRMDKALFADSVATSVGALFGTSNTTTYVESAAGIEAGGRTGMTSLFTALLFLVSIILAPITGLVQTGATAPALIIVGVMMMSSLKDIEWADFAEAVPAFLTIAIMAFSYNISNGMAFGFIFYVIIALLQKRHKELHPIFYGATVLFIVYFVFMALIKVGILAV